MPETRPNYFLLVEGSLRDFIHDSATWTPRIVRRGLTHPNLHVGITFCIVFAIDEKWGQLTENWLVSRCDWTTTKPYKLHLLTRCAERLCLARTFSRFFLWDWRPHKREPPLPSSHQNYLIGATDLFLRCCCEAASKYLRLHRLAVNH